MIHHSEPSTRQCARIWSDNLQLPYTRRLEVIWDQITSNFLVYNPQLPHGRHDHGDSGKHGGSSGQDRTGQDKTGQDGTGRDGTGRDNRDDRDDKDERQVRQEKLERQENIKKHD